MRVLSIIILFFGFQISVFSQAGGFTNAGEDVFRWDADSASGSSVNALTEPFVGGKSIASYPNSVLTIGTTGSSVRSNVGDHVLTLIPSNAFVFEGMFNPGKANPMDNNYVLESNNGPNEGTLKLSVNRGAITLQLNSGPIPGASGPGGIMSYTPEVQSEGFIHVAFTKTVDANGLNTLKLYYNGSLVSTAVATIAYTCTFDYDLAEGITNESYVGQVDNIRVWGGIAINTTLRTEDQIRSYAFAEILPSPPSSAPVNLLANYLFGEPQNQSTYNSTDGLLLSSVILSTSDLGSTHTANDATSYTRTLGADSHYYITSASKSVSGFTCGISTSPVSGLTSSYTNRVIYTVFETPAREDLNLPQVLYKEGTSAQGYVLTMYNAAITFSYYKSSGTIQHISYSNGGGLLPSTRYIVEARVTGNGTGGTKIALYVNGAFAGETGAFSGSVDFTAALSEVAFGNALNGAVLWTPSGDIVYTNRSSVFRGKLFEYVVRNSENSIQQTITTNTLSTIYGIALTSSGSNDIMDYFNENSVYVNMIAGMGYSSASNNQLTSNSDLRVAPYQSGGGDPYYTMWAHNGQPSNSYDIGYNSNTQNAPLNVKLEKREWLVQGFSGSIYADLTASISVPKGRYQSLIGPGEQLVAVIDGSRNGDYRTGGYVVVLKLNAAGTAYTADNVAFQNVHEPTYPHFTLRIGYLNQFEFKASFPSNIVTIGKTNNYDQSANTNSILTLDNVSGLKLSDYILAQDNNAALAFNTTLVMNDNAGTAVNVSVTDRIWKFNVYGTPSAINIAFTKSLLPALPSGKDQYVLILDADGVFNAATSKVVLLSDIGIYKKVFFQAIADGYYMKLGAVKQNVLQSKTNPAKVELSTVTTNASLNLTIADQNSFNGSGGCLQDVSKSTLKVGFYTGDMHTTGNLTFTTAGIVTAIVTITGYSDYAMSSALFTYSNVSLTIDESNPERVWSMDVAGYYPMLKKVKVLVNSYTAPTQVLIVPRLNLSIEETPRTLIPATATSVIRNMDVARAGVEPTAAHIFSWVPDQCPAVTYQFQLLRLYNQKTSYSTSPGVEDRSTLAEESIVSEIDWSKALSIETDQANLQLLLTEGTGFYVWRVRPIGNFYNGGVSDSRNWGNWSTDSYAQSTTSFVKSTFAANANGVLTSNSNTTLWYDQFERDKNFAYQRSFTEGGKIHEGITYATSLLQSKQSIARLNSNGTAGSATDKELLVSQSVYDFAGRAALSTLPAPITNDNDISYQEQFLKNSGNLYTPFNFDTDAKMKTPDPINAGVMNDYYSTANPDPSIPSADGYGFSRTLFDNDGTNQVTEQGGVGPVHTLTTNAANSHTIKMVQGGVSEEELILVFGDEAPNANTVLKTATTDQNNITSITYTDKEGRVIATCLANRKPSCESGAATPYYTDPLSTEGDIRFKIKVEKPINNNIPYGNNGLQASETFVFTDPVTLQISYKITPSLIKNVCGSYCATCGYVLKVDIVDIDNPGSAKESHKTFTIPMVSKTDNSCAATEQAPLSFPDLQLCPGRYSISRTIVPDMNEANKFADDIVTGENVKLTTLTTDLITALNATGASLKSGRLAYGNFIMKAYTDASFDVVLYNKSGTQVLTTVGASSGSFDNTTLQTGYSMIVSTSCCQLNIPVILPPANPCDDDETIFNNTTNQFTDASKFADAMIQVLVERQGGTVGVGFDFANYKLINNQSRSLTDLEWNGTDFREMIKNMKTATVLVNHDQCKKMWNCWNAAASVIGAPNGGVPNRDENTPAKIKTAYNDNKPDDGTTVASFGANMSLPTTNMVESTLDCYGRNYIGFTSDYTTYRQNAFQVFFRVPETKVLLGHYCDKMFCSNEDIGATPDPSNLEKTFCVDIEGCVITYQQMGSSLIFQDKVNSLSSFPNITGKVIDQHIQNMSLKGCLAGYTSVPVTTPPFDPASAFSITKMISDAQVNVTTMIDACKKQCENRDDEFRAATQAFYDPNNTGSYAYYNTGPELIANGNFDANLAGWTSTPNFLFQGTGVYAFTSANPSYKGKYANVLAPTPLGVSTGLIVQSGKKYRLSFEVDVKTGIANGASIVVRNSDKVLYRITNRDKYTQSVVFNATTTISNSTIGFYFETANGSDPVPAFTIDNVSLREVLTETGVTPEDVCCMAQSLTDYCKQQCQLDVVTMDCGIDGQPDKVVSIGTQAQIDKWSAIMYGGFQLSETSTVGGVADQCGTGWEKVTPDVNLTTPAKCLNGVPTKIWDKTFQAGWGWSSNVGNDGYMYNLTTYNFNKVDPVTGTFQYINNRPANNNLDAEDFIIPSNTTNEFLFVDKYPQRLAAIYYVKIDPTFSSRQILWYFQNTNTINETYCGIVESGNGFIAGYSTPANATSVGGVQHKSQNSFGLNDYWVYKVDKSGNLLWEHSFGGTGNDDLKKIQIHGNYLYLIGRSYSGISGNKHVDDFLTTNRSTTPIWWIVKLDLNGNYVDEYEVTVPIPNSYIDNGDFDVLFTGDNEFIFSYGDDVTIKKFTRNQENFTKTYLIGAQRENPLHLYKSKQDGYYILGETSSSSFDKPTPTGMGFGERDILLVKIDDNFNYQWHYVAGGSSDDQTAIENFNNVYLNEINNYIYVLGASKSTPGGIGNRTAPYLSSAQGFPYDTWLVKIAAGSNTACVPKNMCIKWIPLAKPPLNVPPTTVPEEVETDFPPVPPNIETPTQQVAANIALQIGRCGAARYNDLVQQYVDACMHGTINDLLKVKYDHGYQHYTLYYYDRAGNLARTVPPMGVKPVDLLATGAMTRQIHTKHTLVTTYEYNSIGQLSSQFTPDGRETNFIYNSIGQLRFSQNKRQKTDNTCSYTKYDELGRIIEVGECSLTATGVSFAAITPYADANGTFTAFGSTSFPTAGKAQQTITVYTNAATQMAYLDKGQSYLRNRVSYVYTYAINGERAASYYSYDPHGNVNWMMQELPGQSRNTIGYDYDLVSNKVLCAKYNEGQPDAFFHKYTYDADDRLAAVYTSRNRVIWDKDAGYKYYKHGPLKRMETGEDAIQGTDYTYTIQGWLKAMNTPSLTASADPGNDGGTGSNFATDEYGMVLNYYKGDFTRSGSAINNTIYSPITGAAGTHAFVADNNRQLFNGNISSWVSRIQHEYRDYLSKGNTANTVNSDKFTTANYYTYDDLNRITSSAFSEFSSTGSTSANGDKYSRLTPTGKFGTSYSYDGNGNINTLKRYSVDAGGASKLMDDLTYAYAGSSAGAGATSDKNRLINVQDAMTDAGFYMDDIDDAGATDRYAYDSIGNLVYDRGEGIDIAWTVYGKISSVKRHTPTSNTKPEVRYTYDAMGQRIKKEVNMIPYDAGGNPQRLPEQVTTTFYVHDASGNTMSTYKRSNTAVAGQTGYYTASFDQIEIPIYGSSRVGMYEPDAVERVVASKKFQTSDLDHMLYERTAANRSNYDAYWNVASRENTSINNTVAASIAISSTGLWNMTNTGDASTGTYTATPSKAFTFSGKIGNAIAHGLNANGQVQFTAFTALDYFGTPNKLMILSGANSMLMKGAEALTADPQTQIVITQVPGSTSKYYLITRIAQNINSNPVLGYYLIDMSLPGYGTAGAPQGEVVSPYFNASILAMDGSAGKYGKSLLVRENQTTGTTLLYATRYVEPTVPADDCGHIELVVFTLLSDPGQMNYNFMVPEVMCRPIGMLNADLLYNSAANTYSTQMDEQGELAFNAKGNELLYYSQKKRLGWFAHQDAEVLSYELGYDGKIAKNALVAKYTIPVTDPSLPGSSVAISKDGRFVYYTKDQLYKTNGSAAHIWRYDLRNGSNVEVSGQNVAGDLRNLYSGLLVEVADNKSQTALSLQETDLGVTQGGLHNVVYAAVAGQIGNWPLQNFRIYAAASGAQISVRKISRKRYELNDDLGNVTVVVSDRKKVVDVNANPITLIAEVISYTNYYAFGMTIKPRSNDGGEEYRYGYNGQEKESETGSNIYSAQYWEYDARLGRRWNRDPITFSWQSSYGVFNNNPIYYSDPQGLYGSERKARKMQARAVKAGAAIEDGTVYNSGGKNGWGFNSDRKGENGEVEIFQITSGRYFGGTSENASQFIDDINFIDSYEYYIGGLVKVVGKGYGETGKNFKTVIPFGGVQYSKNSTNKSGEFNMITADDTYISAKTKLGEVRYYPAAGLATGDYAGGYGRYLSPCPDIPLVVIPVGGIRVPIVTGKVQADVRASRNNLKAGARVMAETITVPNFLNVGKGKLESGSGLSIEVNSGFLFDLKIPAIFSEDE